MTTDLVAGHGVPQALRARYAVLRRIAGDASGYAPERATAGLAADVLARKYPALTAIVDDKSSEPRHLDGNDMWTWGRIDVPGTAGLGRIRTEAATTIIHAHDVSTVQVDWRHHTGETELAYYGRRPIVEHLGATLPGILAALDAAALAATRRYRQWMRDRDDTAPAWHASMCRHWRREYLAAAGSAYARQLRAAAHPPPLAAGPHVAPAMGHYNAGEFAAADSLHLDPAPLRATLAVIEAAQLAAGAAARRELDNAAPPQITASSLIHFTIGV